MKKGERNAPIGLQYLNTGENGGMKTRGRETAEKATTSYGERGKSGKSTSPGTPLESGESRWRELYLNVGSPAKGERGGERLQSFNDSPPAAVGGTFWSTIRHEP